MAVKLRLVRLGRRHRAFFRLRVGDERNAPTGRFIEELGFVDPHAKKDADHVNLNKERIEHWLSQGAQPSETVAKLLEKHGIGLSEKAAETATA